MRLIVSQPHSALADGRPTGLIPVGVTRWRGPEDLFGVVVKVTFTFQQGDPGVETALVAPEPLSLQLDTDSELGGAGEGELAYGTDLGFYKPRCDVLLTGHAHAKQAVNGIDAAIRVADVERRFQVVASAAATALPLSQSYLRDPLGAHPCPIVGPRVLQREDADTAFAPEQLVTQQLAVEDQQAAKLPDDALIVLTGLSPRGPERQVKLPGLRPQLFVGAGDYGEGVLALTFDTLWIDTDLEIMVGLWRGILPLPASEARQIDRMIVTLEDSQHPRDVAAIEREVGRGRFHYAVEEDDLPEGPPAVDDDALVFTKLRAREPTPEPTITLEVYAEVSAELAEQREPRNEVLRRHGFDEAIWLLEERAWLSRMAAATTGQAGAGGLELAMRYGELYLAAQERLADPAEAKLTVDQYAELKVSLDEARDPADVLRAHELSLPAWMRIDRRWCAAARDDDEVAKQVDRAMTRARQARPQAGVAEEDR